MNKDKAHANDVLKELSSKYGRTVSQIMLRWANQRGCAVIPGTGNPGEWQKNHGLYAFACYSDSSLTPYYDSVRYATTSIRIRIGRAYEGKSKCL